MKKKNHYPPKPPCETCEVRDTEGRQCGKPVAYTYPTMIGGFASLCEEHAVPHKDYAKPFRYATDEQVKEAMAWVFEKYGTVFKRLRDASD